MHPVEDEARARRTPARHWSWLIIRQADSSRFGADAAGSAEPEPRGHGARQVAARRHGAARGSDRHGQTNVDVSSL